MLTKILEYKAREIGSIVQKIDRYYPSSQICHVCGTKNPETKNLAVREWICTKCKTSHDRDRKADINNGHNLVGDVNYYVMPSDTFKQLEKLGLVDEVPPHIGFITAHEGRYSKLRLITKKAATKVTPAVDKYMLAWSAVKGRYINSSVSNKKVNSAAIVECKGFKVRERQI